jgi:hypothetical protein
VQVGYEGAGLAPGLYAGVITFSSPNVPGEEIKIPVTLLLPGGQVFLPVIAR